MHPGAQLLFTGIATDDHGVAGVTIDGALEEIVLDEEGHFEAWVRLAPGANEIHAIATDEAGQEAEVVSNVYFGHRLSVGNSQAAYLRGTELFTWGRNELGQLGNGTLDPSGYEDAPNPVRYQVALENAVSIVTRSIFMSALTSDGHVATWGSNSDGQLGYDAEAGDQGAPTKIEGLSDVIAIASGNVNLYALLRDSTLLSCGRNHAGQTGNGILAGDDVTTLTPVLTLDEAGEAIPLSGVTHISADGFVAAATLEDGQLFTWGFGRLGQLGRGNLEDVEEGEDPRDLQDYAHAGPVAADDPAHFHILETEVGAGGGILALTTEHNLFAWGWSFRGSLGLEGAFNT